MKWYADSSAPRSAGSACDRSELARSYATREFAATLAAAAALANGSQRAPRALPLPAGSGDGYAAGSSLQAAINDMQSAIAELHLVEAHYGTAETRACLERMERSLQAIRGAIDEPTAV